MSEPLFSGAWAKVERAKKHVADLEVAFKSFVQSDPYSLGFSTDANTGEMAVRIRLRTPLPADIALIIGDAVHNLRTALDHATWELVGRDSGTQDRWLKFPSGDSDVSYKAACNGIKTPRADTKKFFAALEAHPRGRCAPLYYLGLIDNDDKHTVLTPVFAIAALANVRVTGPGGQVIATFDHLQTNIGVDGIAHVASVGAGLTFELDQKAQPPPDVFFGNVEAFQFKPIIPTLVMLRHEVEQTLREFDAFVRGRPA